MNKWFKSISIVAFLYVSVVSANSEECKEVLKMDDNQIRQHIVRASVAHYLSSVGSCPCPYSFDNFYNTYCGASSAYARNNGQFPKCYPGNLTGIDIAAYKNAICSNDPSEGQKQPTESNPEPDSGQKNDEQQNK